MEVKPHTPNAALICDPGIESRLRYGCLCVSLCVVCNSMFHTETGSLDFQRTRATGKINKGRKK
jgi:hypothetical protein